MENTTFDKNGNYIGERIYFDKKIRCFVHLVRIQDGGYSVVYSLDTNGLRRAFCSSNRIKRVPITEKYKKDNIVLVEEITDYADFTEDDNWIIKKSVR